jgi:hypothetical protein
VQYRVVPAKKGLFSTTQKQLIITKKGKIQNATKKLVAAIQQFNQIASNPANYDMNEKDIGDMKSSITLSTQKTFAPAEPKQPDVGNGALEVKGV